MVCRDNSALGSGIRENTHLVLKVEDVYNYLEEPDIAILEILVNKINKGRRNDGKKENSYYVVNTDEPYAESIIDLIIREESTKQGMKGN